MTVYQLKVEEKLMLASQCLQTIDNYKKRIHDEKEKLLNDQTVISLSTFAHLMDIITLRQNNMHERTQHLHKRQIRFSSDHIPTM